MILYPLSSIFELVSSIFDLVSSIFELVSSIFDLAASADCPAEHSRDVVNRRAVAVHVKHGRQCAQQPLISASLLSRIAKLSRQIAHVHSFFAMRASERAHHDRRKHHQQRPDFAQIESAGLTDAALDGAFLVAEYVESMPAPRPDK